MFSAVRSRGGVCLGDVVGWQKEARSERANTETGRRLAGEHQRQESTVVHYAVAVCSCVCSRLVLYSRVLRQESTIVHCAVAVCCCVRGRPVLYSCTVEC